MAKAGWSCTLLFQLILYSHSIKEKNYGLQGKTKHKSNAADIYLGRWESWIWIFACSLLWNHSRLKAGCAPHSPVRLSLLKSRGARELLFVTLVWPVWERHPRLCHCACPMECCVGWAQGLCTQWGCWKIQVFQALPCPSRRQVSFVWIALL